MPGPGAVVGSGEDLALRALLGLILAGAIAGTAWKLRALAPTGVVAATAIGAACAGAGWDWAILLIAFFLTSTALGRVRRDRRAAATGRVVDKGGARDGLQVLANGGVFALAAIGYLVWPSPGWLAAGGGALASASSDTWATEIGSLAARRPIHVLTGQPVTPGTSGAITTLGTVASFGGALFIGLAAALFLWPSSVVIATVVGGFAGAFADTLLGATIQVRRWCDRCESGTEQAVHVCGSATRVAGGLRRIDNDVVNLLAVLVGAAIAFVLFAVLESRFTS